MSNPFAPRPELRTSSGTAIAKKRTPGSGLAVSQLTTSADGEYYDLELTPGEQGLSFALALQVLGSAAWG